MQNFVRNCEQMARTYYLIIFNSENLNNKFKYHALNVGWFKNMYYFVR